MGISVQEQMLIEQRVTNEAKSVGVAYLLWLFLGTLGGHRFYLGRTITALLMLLLFVVGFITAFVGIGFIFIGIVGLWALIDAFLIPGMVSKQKDDVRQRLTSKAMMANAATA